MQKSLSDSYMITACWHHQVCTYSLAVYIIMSVFVCTIRSCAAGKAVGSLDMSIVWGMVDFIIPVELYIARILEFFSM